MLTNDDILSLAESYGNWSMSDFQSRYFVVNSHVTDYRRVKQAVLEIETRIAAKKQMERNLKRNDILIKLKIEEIAAEPNPLKQELLLIDLDQYQYDNSVYEKKLRICEEELDMFCNLIKELVPDKESLENYKGHNEEKEREYWILRMGKQAALDMLALGRIGQGNLDSISMMPIEDQQEVIRLGLSYTNSLNKAIGYMDEDVKLELTNTKKISTIDKLLASQHKTSSEQID
jgi:hypothetical protein